MQIISIFNIDFIDKVMNSNRPVQLSQKIDYLHEKISKVHTEIRRNDDLELRLNFEQFIDQCIREIVTIHQRSSPIKPKTEPTKQENPKQFYSIQSEKLQFERKIVQYKMQQLENKQILMEYETLKLQLFNKQKENQKLERSKIEIRRENLKEIQRQNDRNKFLQQQIEKLVKLNKAQEQQIKIVKEQRNRAELKQLQIQQKYDEDIGKLQKFSQKKPKYLDRNTQGLKCTRYYTNVSPPNLTGGSSQKLVILKLPVTIQVNKLVYGIMLGIQVTSKQVVYYDKLQLYEKQATRVELEGEWLVLNYKRRKDNERVVLDKFNVRVPEIVIMLFGRGDSIMVHQ